ncbi:hypothetical protein Daus18300_001498 [Diaporthe australafricana]|uniref:Chromo domain-containing protein n=1 Tax=Diaporthe australafricana TaxID=127596 RepID=A0ABR3XVU5_9PEZI
MATDLEAASTSGLTVTSESALLDDLNPLHVAVLKGNYAEVRGLIANGDVGVDSRSATGSTPIMLAALYGHYRIFELLSRKDVHTNKKDAQGLNALDYAKHSTFTEELCRRYKGIAFNSPNHGGQVHIRNRLKILKRERERGRDKGRNRRGQVPVQKVLRLLKRERERGRCQGLAEAQQALTQTPQVSSHDTGRTGFIRSKDEKFLEYVEIRCLASTMVNQRLERKATAIMRGVNEDGTDTFAVSGWSGLHGENILNNQDYTSLVRQTCAIYDFVLPGYPSDGSFVGDPAKKKGAFFSCHAEKQLGIYVFLKSLSKVLNTKAITTSNIAALSKQLEKLPARLSHTTIELDHEPCQNCLDFLDLLRSKAGLVIVCEVREWYTYGQRQKIRFRPDGSYEPVSGADDADVMEDEIDAHKRDGTLKDEPQGDTAEGKPSSPIRRVAKGPQPSVREPLGWVKKGSPVHEEPKPSKKDYAFFNVTPPSQKVSSLLTPRSHFEPHDYLAGIPPVPVSPSPGGVLSAFGSEDCMDGENPPLSQEFGVDEILDSKETRDDGRVYRVKWENYSHEYNSWEKEGHLANALAPLASSGRNFTRPLDRRVILESSES